MAVSVQIEEPPLKIPEPVAVTPPPAAVAAAAVVGFDSKFVQSLLEAQVISFYYYTILNSILNIIVIIILVIIFRICIFIFL